MWPMSPSSDSASDCLSAVKPGTMDSLTLGPAVYIFFTTRLQFLLHTTCDVKCWNGSLAKKIFFFGAFPSQSPGKFQVCGKEHSPSDLPLLDLLCNGFEVKTFSHLCFLLSSPPLTGMEWLMLVWKNTAWLAEALELFSSW